MGLIKSRIFKDTGLLIQEYSGELNKNDMAIYFTGLYQNPEYLDVSLIFSDFTKVHVSFSVNETIEIANFILAYAPKVQLVNNSILVSEPLVTAYSMLYEQIMKVMPLYRCSIFSTFKGAADYINFDTNRLDTLIKTSFAS